MLGLLNRVANLYIQSDGEPQGWTGLLRYERSNHFLLGFPKLWIVRRPFPPDDIGMTWWRFLCPDFKLHRAHCGSLDDGSAVDAALSTDFLLCDRFQLIERLGTMPEYGGFSILGAGQKCRRFHG